MLRRWREPGGDWWVKVAVWAFVIALALFFVIQLGSALLHRFGTIKRNYEEPMRP